MSYNQCFAYMFNIITTDDGTCNFEVCIPGGIIWKIISDFVLLKMPKQRSRRRAAPVDLRDLDPIESSEVQALPTTILMPKRCAAF